jgi:hypothetical protein
MLFWGLSHTGEGLSKCLQVLSVDSSQGSAAKGHSHTSSLSPQDTGDRGCGLPAAGVVWLAERLLLLWWPHLALGVLPVQVPAK